jgi:hypothetical protein
MLLKPLFTSLISTAVPLSQLGGLVLQTLVFALMGIVIFAIAFWIIVKATPFQFVRRSKKIKMWHGSFNWFDHHRYRHSSSRSHSGLNFQCIARLCFF